MQVEPLKSKLKATGAERLKLKHDDLLSRFAFKFNLRRYNMALRTTILAKMTNRLMSLATANGLAAGAYTRPLFSST